MPFCIQRPAQIYRSQAKAGKKVETPRLRKQFERSVVSQRNSPASQWRPPGNLVLVDTVFPLDTTVIRLCDWWFVGLILRG